MTKPTVVVTRAIPHDAIALLASRCAVVCGTGDEPLAPEALTELARHADALVTLLTDRIDDALLAVCPRLRIVANVAVGYDNIDVAAAARRGIIVTNTPGVLTDATADFAWALLLAVTRRIVEADAYVRAGRFTEWKMMDFHGADLAGKTIGIAGFGRIGQAVARRAHGFGMNVIYTNRRPVARELEVATGARAVEKEELLRESDVLSLHVPYSESTRHFLGARELDAMKASAFLINTARGPVVDEDALARALASGSIRGAGLDVFEHEPAVEPRLLTMSNVVLAPHIGSATVETRTNMALMAANNVLAVLDGANALNPVW